MNIMPALFLAVLFQRRAAPKMENVPLGDRAFAPANDRGAVFQRRAAPKMENVPLGDRAFAPADDRGVAPKLEKRSLRGPDVALGAVVAWQLSAHEAQTLTPPSAGQLFVLEGRAWLTGGDPPLPGPSDLVLRAGQSLALSARQSVVIEAWPVAGEALRLAWQAGSPAA